MVNLKQEIFESLSYSIAEYLEGIAIRDHWAVTQKQRLSSIHADKKLLSAMRKLEKQADPKVIAEFFARAINLPEELDFVLKDGKSVLKLEHESLRNAAENFLSVISARRDSVTIYLSPAPSSSPHFLEIGEKKYLSLVEDVCSIRDRAEHFRDLTVNLHLPTLPREHNDEGALCRAFVRSLTRIAERDFGKQLRPAVARLATICLSLDEDPSPVKMRDILKRSVESAN